MAQGVYALASDLSETEERLKAEVEASTGGRNTVLFDDMRKPSIMVRISKFFLSDVMDSITAGSAEDKIHPAFIVNGEVKNEILISKYQNVVIGERAYSLPSRDPKTSINYDKAHDACNKKGEGWHLMTNAEWAALALYSLKNKTEPLGNNNCGVDNTNKLMAAIESYTWKLSYDWNNRSYKEEPIGTFWHTGRTATGSGPDKFSHDHTNSGVFDLNGNAHEWVGGLRLRNGEIQVIKDNDAAETNTDHSDASPLWMGITDGNNYTMPGSARTLKLDNTAVGSGGETGIKIGGSLVFNIARDFPHFTGGEVNEYYGYNYNSLKNVAFKEGVIKPQLFEELCICSPGNQGEDRLYARNYGERLPIRGGDWHDSSTAGVFALNLGSHRLASSSYVGFRSAFVS
ncbi:MAG: hypothetical protein B7C24_13110 [Bacteroidetes bacterium 4572_77]|nr:MAG: hypothetical protein B7C24_13110 [Bacteroidetes bacterium 4572_77]